MARSGAFAVEWSIDKEWARAMNRLQNFKDLAPAVYEGGAHVERRAMIYGQEPPNSTYERKGARGGLASKWKRPTRKASQHEISFTIENNADYAIWVKGAVNPEGGMPGQARVHKGRWKGIDEDFQDSEPDIVRAVDKVMKDIMR